MALTTTEQASQRAQKLRELAEVRRQLVAARQRKAAAAVGYTSTSDGVGETYRRFELARGAAREELRAMYLAGLSLAEKEFEHRRALGHSGDCDGPLAAVGVGSFDDPVARVLIEHQVMGWVRTGPAVADDGVAVVGLVRLLPDMRSRERLRLRCPAADAVLGIFTSTLAEVVEQAWADLRVRPRVQRFLGEPGCAALTQMLGQAQR